MLHPYQASRREMIRRLQPMPTQLGPVRQLFKFCLDLQVVGQVIIADGLITKIQQIAGGQSFDLQYPGLRWSWRQTGRCRDSHPIRLFGVLTLWTAVRMLLDRLCSRQGGSFPLAGSPRLESLALGSGHLKQSRQIRLYPSRDVNLISVAVGKSFSRSVK